MDAFIALPAERRRLICDEAGSVRGLASAIICDGDDIMIMMQIDLQI
jgi:hypothetical protein